MNIIFNKTLYYMIIIKFADCHDGLDRKHNLMIHI